MCLSIFPSARFPKVKKERTKFHKEVDAVLLQDAKYQALHEQFQTKMALAKELGEAAIRRKLAFSVVLFDSWYLAEEFIACLRRRRKDWISILKKNRNLETYSFMLKDTHGKRIPLEGPHISLEDLVPLIPAQAYCTFTLTVRLPGLGKVRQVISFDNPQLKGTYPVLVSNRVEWTALRMIATYLHPWPIESFYQDGKEHLGFDEDRMRNATATLREKQCCLLFVAYSLWHLDCLPTSLKQSHLPIKTIGQACRQQAQALILYASLQLEQGQNANDLFTYLFAKQQTLALA